MTVGDERHSSISGRDGLALKTIISSASIYLYYYTSKVMDPAAFDFQAPLIQGVGVPELLQILRKFLTFDPKDPQILSPPLGVVLFVLKLHSLQGVFEGIHEKLTLAVQAEFIQIPCIHVPLDEGFFAMKLGELLPQTVELRL